MKLLATAILLTAACAPTAFAADNPWNGSWTLDAARSTPGIKDAAADGYRFTITPDNRITWEIPSLGEVVKGRIDGRPMIIYRHGKADGMTIAVHPEGPTVLIYKVTRDGKPNGEGRMTLVDNGRAWVDISWGAGNPVLAGEIVYVKQ